MRRHAGILEARVGRDETNLVQTDALGAFERGFQLYGEFSGLCFARWECAGKPDNLFLGDRGKKLNAGQSGGGEQLRKLLFGGSAFQGNAIQQQLGASRPEHQPVLRSRGHRRLKFVPGDIQLFGGAGVFETV